LEVRKNVTPFWYDDWTLTEMIVATHGKNDSQLITFWQTEDNKNLEDSSLLSVEKEQLAKEINEMKKGMKELQDTVKESINSAMKQSGEEVKTQLAQWTKDLLEDIKAQLAVERPEIQSLQKGMKAVQDIVNDSINSVKQSAGEVQVQLAKEKKDEMEQRITELQVNVKESINSAMKHNTEDVLKTIKTQLAEERKVYSKVSMHIKHSLNLTKFML